jgi:hypothetical protein
MPTERMRGPSVWFSRQAAAFQILIKANFPGNFLCPFPLHNQRAAASDTNKEGKGTDKSLAFLICYFLVCSTTKRIFLVWVKEVRTKKS